MKKLSTVAVISLIVFSLACDRTDNANNANRPANANANANANVARDTGASDTWITTKVKLALLADNRVSGFATDVDTRSGVVTLSGKVDEQSNKSAAEEVAKGIDGVKGVNNQIQVVPDAKRSQVNAADDKIEDAIKKAMDADANLKGLGLRADSNAGVVTLDGSVDTQDQLVNAAQAIRKILGVKSVVTTPVTVKNERRS
jgi:hyperosmotically inducible periplasmic protein